MLISIRPMSGSRLPFIAATMSLSAGSALCGKQRRAKARIRFEHDLLAATPLLQPVGTGADRVRHRPRARIAVRIDHLARNRRRGRRREVRQKTVRRVRELELQSCSDRPPSQSLDGRVVVEPARLLRLRDERVGADENLVEHLQIRRMDLGIEDPLPGIDVIGGDELALLSLERGVVGEIDARLQLDRPR